MLHQTLDQVEMVLVLVLVEVLVDLVLLFLDTLRLLSVDNV